MYVVYVVSASTLLAIVDMPGHRVAPSTWVSAPVVARQRVVAECKRWLDAGITFPLWIGEGTNDPKARVEAVAAPFGVNWLLFPQPTEVLPPSVDELLPDPLPVIWHGIPSGVPSAARFWHAWCDEVAAILSASPVPEAESGVGGTWTGSDILKAPRRDEHRGAFSLAILALAWV